MLYGEITAIKTCGYAFVKVNDPTSDEFGQRFFLHKDGVSSESLVSFDDCHLHDSVAFDVEDDIRGRGARAVAAMITEREAGERFTGVVKNYSATGFCFVTLVIDENEDGRKDFFCHASECEFGLTADSVGM
jgi:cold shock CspA family protein